MALEELAGAGQRGLAGGGHRRPQGGDERPASGCRRRAEAVEPTHPGATAPTPRPALRSLAPGPGADQGAQRGEGVVGDLTGPDQVPEHGQQGGVVPLQVGVGHRSLEVGPERGAPRREVGPQHVVHRSLGRRGGVGLRDQEAQLVAEHQPHPPVVGADGPGPHPDHLARGGQGVEVGGAVLVHAGREDVGLQHRGGDGCALQHAEGLDQPVDPAAGQSDPLPRRQEASQGVGLDRFHLAAQGGQRPAPDAPQDLGVAPLPLHPAGAELALHHPTLGGEVGQGGHHPGLVDGEALGDLAGQEGAVGAGVAGHQVVQRCLHRVGERRGQADGHGAPEGVAEPGRVLGRRHLLGAGHPDPDGPPGRHEVVDPALDHDPDRGLVPARRRPDRRLGHRLGAALGPLLRARRGTRGSLGGRCAGDPPAGDGTVRGRFAGDSLPEERFPARPTTIRCRFAGRQTRQRW